MEEVEAMKKLALILGIVVAIAGFMTLNAQAIPITGVINFSGSATMDSTDLGAATKIVGYTNIVVGIASGDYSPLAFTAPATFTPFSFNPADASVIPLWTVVFNGITYSFDATSVAIKSQDSTFLNIFGSGVAHISDPANPGKYTDTIGSWSITETGGVDFTFAFGATTAVPEPTSLLLYGLGLIGLAGYRYRNNLRKN